ncbi:MAG: hypothetical protein U1C58_11645 [Flavobacteriaceae bacterium]|nr:hypothetical protein [Flavobacteriaceae bacterium]
MKKLSLKNVAEFLKRDQMRTIIAGSGGFTGGWWCSCNSGVNIGSVPSCTSSNCNFACFNQGGWSEACGCAC